MLDPKTKERIAKDAVACANSQGYYVPAFQVGYIVGGEAEATRSEAGIEILKELCQLKKYKDEMGKTSFYEKRQPELWKMANDFLNNYNKPDK